MTSDTVKIEVEIPKETLLLVDDAVNSGQYEDREEFIVSAIRIQALEYLRGKTFLKSLKVEAKQT